MKKAAILAVLALAACSGSETPADGETATSEAPARTPAQQLLTSLTDPRQEGAWAPRDECSGSPGAAAFRENLAEAVVARDADALVALADPDILLDFGGGSGRDELRQRLGDPEAKMWEALENLLPLGCAVNEAGGITMPWYFAQDIGDRDSFMMMIVRGEDVPLLAEPKSDAKVLKTISWEAVELEPDADFEATYAPVNDYNGTKGYIAWDSMRSLIDYRLLADDSGEGWALNAFVAGD